MNTAIIGGGASGMIAAIVSSRYGDDVTIFEHMSRMGKKLLLTGSGKCNISNTDMDLSHFHGGDPKVIETVLKKYTRNDTMMFYEKLGLDLKERNGCLYPYCEQASAVVDVLRFAIRDLGIDVVTDADVKYIRRTESADGRDVSDTLVVVTSQGRFLFDKVIICTGSASNRNTGSDGSGYELARSLGHTIIKPLPALTFITCEDDFFPSIAGIRTKAEVSLYTINEDDRSRTLLGSRCGELQLVRAGVSGIPVFDLSYLAAYHLDRGENVRVSIDFLPDVSEDDIHDFIKTRTQNLADRTAEELFIGLFAKPVGICICKRCGIDLKMKCSSIPEGTIAELCRMIRGFEAAATGTGNFDSSQVLQGGVSLSEVTPDLESILVPGLFFAGEVLDVNGDCGGYNLQWAASSAMAAAAGGRDKKDTVL